MLLHLIRIRRFGNLFWAVFNGTDHLVVELGLSVGRKSMSLTFVHCHLEIVYSVTFFTRSLFSQAASECTRGFSELKMWNHSSKMVVLIGKQWFREALNASGNSWYSVHRIVGKRVNVVMWKMGGGGEELEVHKWFGLVQSGVKLTPQSPFYAASVTWLCISCFIYKSSRGIFGLHRKHTLEGEEPYVRIYIQEYFIIL